MTRRLLLLLLLGANVALAQTTTTTITISNTIKQAKVYRFGINLGGITNFQTNQYLKDLNYYNGGNMPGVYWDTSFTCQNGGTNDTTHWYSNTADGANGYPANFWVGASYVAYAASSGLTIGSGTITASTFNNTSGLQFTLGSALSTTCSTANQDALIVYFSNAPDSLSTPQNIYGTIPSGATWNTADHSPNFTNTIHSLQLPAGSAWTYTMDVASHPGTNTNPTVKASNASWVDLNGSYNLIIEHKCVDASGTGSIQYSLGRNGGTSYVGSTTVSDACTATSGAGWTTSTVSFTGSEVGLQSGGGLLFRILNTTGTELIQRATVIEGTAISPANNSIFRDAVVKKLRELNPGSIRFMDGSDWCSVIADETGPVGNNRFCGFSEYAPFSASVPVGYHDKLGLCVAVGTDCWLTIGVYNPPSAWGTFPAWLAADSNYIALRAAGHDVYLEDANEPWNFGSQGQPYQGAGKVYGNLLGQKMAAFKAGSGYDAAHMHTVMAGWFSQGWNNSGNWSYNAALMAQSTGSLPEYGDQGPYTLNYLSNFDSSGSDVSTTGAPFLDAAAENFNENSLPVPSGSLSMLTNTTNALSNFGLKMSVYEANQALLFGQAVALTQTQIDELAGGWDEALTTIGGFSLMHRDSGVTGPINTFKLLQDEYGATSVAPTSQIPLWGLLRTLQCGPGEITTCEDGERPDFTLERLYNTTVGNNTAVVSTTQSGTPVTAYAGGQSISAIPYSIAANTNIAQVQCTEYSNGGNSRTLECFNYDLVNSQNIALAGPGAPTGSVSRYDLPGTGNTTITHCENVYTGPSTIPCTITYPASNSAAGPFNIPAGGMIALTYTLSSTNPTISGGSTIAGGSTIH